MNMNLSGEDSDSDSYHEQNTEHKTKPKVREGPYLFPLQLQWHSRG